MGNINRGKCTFSLPIYFDKIAYQITLPINKDVVTISNAYKIIFLKLSILSIIVFILTAPWPKYNSLCSPPPHCRHVTWIINYCEVDMFHFVTNCKMLKNRDFWLHVISRWSHKVVVTLHGLAVRSIRVTVR